MRTPIAVAGILAATSSMAASDIPVRFLTGPFLAPVRVYDMAPGEVAVMCGAFSIPDGPRKGGDEACAIFSRGTDRGWEFRDHADACNIFIIGSDEGYFTAEITYESTLEHEKAHCRGWPPDHPD